MVRTQIYLTEERRKLQSLARRTGRKQSRLIFAKRSTSCFRTPCPKIGGSR